jgi:hypothetical protein
MSASLHVIMYHYVRDLPNTCFPRIKGMHTEDFCRQLMALRNRYEIATLESALEFVQGKYTPVRDLCLLTFDDGLKEHYAEVTPRLIDQRIQGLFFVITSCLAGGRVVPVHMNHFLMAALTFETYRDAFLERLADVSDSRSHAEVDPRIAQRTYRWDSAEVASFKYLFNFVLDCRLRDEILSDLFEEHIGNVESFACTLYLNPKEAREMQAAGMVIGGHSHHHKPLSSFSDKELESDLLACHELLTAHLYPQPLLPFCYPYGKKDSFTSNALRQLKQLGFACSFSTERGPNIPGTDRYALRRHDPKDMPLQ